MTERQFAAEVVAKLQAAGHVALWAGGCVRDELLGIAPADYDIATSARPEQVQAAFRRCHGFGASFGVVEVLGPRGPAGDWLKVQVATFRSDGNYSDGRRPDSVQFSSPEEDAKRRDFTINGLFLDPATGEVFDYVDGRPDLERRLLRAIGDPAERFAEDKLRFLRAARMAARFELSVEPETAAAIRAMAPQVTVVSPERIAEELRKLLTHPHRRRGAELLAELGLAGAIFPQLKLPHEWDAAAEVLGRLPDGPSVPLAFAAAWHQIPLLETVRAECRRLRLSNEESARIAWLLSHAAVPSASRSLPPSRLYPVLAHPGAGELVALAAALHRGAEDVSHAARLLRDLPPERLNPPPLLTGDDLKARGHKPGPQFKRWLDAVRAAQLDGEIADAEGAWGFVERLSRA